MNVDLPSRHNDQRPNVIHAVDMVGVGVREQYPIKTRDIQRQ